MDASYKPPYMKKKEKKNTEIREENVVVKTKNEIKGIETFKGLMINAVMLKNMEAEGITEPTLVQKYAVPLAVYGNDMLICAPTGMGKTIAFLVPIINALAGTKQNRKGAKGEHSRKRGTGVRALVLTPTRELAMQIHDNVEMLAKGLNVSSAAVYGGTENRRSQVAAVKQGVDILIGCPGRLKDFASDKTISLKHIEILVFDEADRMLDMGFEVQIRALLANLDESVSRQTMMFSATFPKQVHDIAREYFQQEYSELYVGHGPLENITQQLIYTDSAEMKHKRKEEKLLELLAEYGHVVGSEIVRESECAGRSVEKVQRKKLLWRKKPEAEEAKKEECKKEKQKQKEMPKVVVFTEKKIDCKTLAEYLASRGIKCVSIHGDKTQPEREYALAEFKATESPVLIATSVAARGIDIPGIMLVVNYTMPSDTKEYIHRIGRTGRAGKKGNAVTFISHKDANAAEALIDILQKANQSVPSFLKDMAVPCARKEKWRAQAKMKEEKVQAERTHIAQSMQECPFKIRDIAKKGEKIELDDNNASWDTEIA